MSIMTDSPIRFPGLFGDWAFTASSTAFHIGGKAIYWYGILIALGVLAALAFCIKQKERYGIKEDDLMDGVLWGVPLAIVGARLYYVLFYLDRFKKEDGSFDWAESVAIWDGGLAIYGGVIGGVLAGWIYSRVKKVSFGTLADLVAPGLAFGQAVGRWGNFLNQEAYGAAVTNPHLQFFPLSVYIEGSGWHYATFFYESLWCALICIFLLRAEKRGYFKRKGDTFLWYLFLYALERCLVEGLRTDSLYIPGTAMRVSQAVALLSFLGGLLIFVINRKKHFLRPVGAVQTKTEEHNEK